MIVSLFKFFAYFCLSYLILSFPINRKPIFVYINALAMPYTTQIFYQTSEKVGDAKDYAKKLFSNSYPLDEEVERVQESFSNGQIEDDYLDEDNLAISPSVLKTIEREKENREVSEKKEAHSTNYDQEDTDKLNQLIKKFTL